MGSLVVEWDENLHKAGSDGWNPPESTDPATRVREETQANTSQGDSNNLLQ